MKRHGMPNSGLLCYGSSPWRDACSYRAWQTTIPPSSGFHPSMLVFYTDHSGKDMSYILLGKLILEIPKRNELRFEDCSNHVSPGNDPNQFTLIRHRDPDNTIFL